MQTVDVDTITKGDAAERTMALFQQRQDAIYRRSDRFFARLMIFQWLAGIAAALWISPKAWAGAYSQTHWHVWAAIFLGGAITGFPVFLAWKQSGRALTRHSIAVAQMLTSALLIHLTGGRIETHFHVFGSLAFLAFYRDWRVLVTATVVVAADHMSRGLFWPQSVFGVLTASPWRWLEHAGWVLFEDTFLLISIRQSLGEMFETAMRRARLETVNGEIEQKVVERTAELRASEQRFRALSTSAPIAILLTNAAGSGLYTNPHWQKITGMSLQDSLGDGWQKALHPDDASEFISDWKRADDERREFDREIRFRTTAGEVRWVHARSTVNRSEAGEITGHVGTVEDITARKRAEAELEKVHMQLLESSRQAGMAEVATGVLHNVGNVLNSVNVSATVVSENLKKSRACNLSHVAALFEEHAADLGGFLTADPKGRRLPIYLGQLARHLAGEQAEMLKELELLRKNIEHIKDIVAMQQSYARVSGVTEQVNIADLIEDALNLNAGALMRHQVEVVRQYQARPTLTVDKHKVLQILVNLIRNAKYACDESGRTDKRLTVQVTNGAGRVKIAVTDNGIGIPTENLTRIFNHGFTTRKEGHGFGLHSGALAAKELGGALTVHSEGVGRGAGFTLELPLEPSKPGKRYGKESESGGPVQMPATSCQLTQIGEAAANPASREAEVFVMS